MAEEDFGVIPLPTYPTDVFEADRTWMDLEFIER
jgi:hypothetical protein